MDHEAFVRAREDEIVRTVAARTITEWLPASGGHRRRRTWDASRHTTNVLLVTERRLRRLALGLTGLTAVNVVVVLVEILTRG